MYVCMYVGPLYVTVCMLMDLTCTRTAIRVNVSDIYTTPIARCSKLFTCELPVVLNVKLKLLFSLYVYAIMY
jgi:hypothetical protein